MAGEQPKPFQLVSGNVVLDLVNTLDNRFSENGPDELLGSYADVLRFLAEAGIFAASDAEKLKRLARNDERGAARVLGRVKELREAAAVVLYALVDGERVSGARLLVLEKCIREARAARALVAEGDRLAWKWRTVTDCAFPLWVLASAAEELLVSGEVAASRSCANPTCRWLFLDTSKNHTRRWCDMKLCGNRSKAQRFRAREERG